MDADEIRRRIIVALVSDDELLDLLVLKGGNALALAHGIGERASLDLDFSLEEDFESATDCSQRIERALVSEFGRLNIEVIDFKLLPRPSVGRGVPHWWGGYRVEFKLVGQEKRAGAKDAQVLRNRAFTIGDGVQNRTFSIDISKYEYTASRVTVSVDGFAVNSYSLEMIVAEKIKAICQQMPEYTMGNRRPRPRDFYDIHSVIERGAVLLGSPGFLDIVRAVFAAKRVPLALIEKICADDVYEFHLSDWSSVVTSSSGVAGDFRFYFEYLCGRIHSLQPLWVE